ncbi:MAG: NAD-dependent epimerase/dehydratase family protein [Syntrophales bacterium]|jgi:UDP-glucose 4-epimerase|nr:NAD-dependent epimerase/dehydratase family protein [Syntrophales bacterium]MDX9922928.1 NAD-dependent epimerase/dehydratase family protein [Syntrophales bacterium]
MSKPRIEKWEEPHLVLITGATGAIGPLVVNEFFNAGFSVRTLSLHQPESDIWPLDVDARIGDITDASSVADAMEGADAVIHMAALLHIVNLPPGLERLYEQVNVGGTSVVVGAALRAGVRRIVFFSTIAVYGRSDGKIVTEHDPVRPDTFYARTKLEAENIVLRATNPEGGHIGSVLRLGAVYGSRIKGNYQRLVHSLARGRFVPIGTGNNRRSLVYDKDVARAAVLVAGHDDAAGKIFNVTDGSFHTVNEIIGAICHALGRKPPSVSLPLSAVRLATGFIEDGVKLLGWQPPVSRETIDKYTEDIAVDSRRIQRELGFKPQYDLNAGWKETVEAMGYAGVL